MYKPKKDSQNEAEFVFYRIKAEKLWEVSASTNAACSKTPFLHFGQFKHPLSLCFQNINNCNLTYL